MLTAYEQGSTVVIVPLRARARPTATAPWRSPSEDAAWVCDDLPGRLA
jgi:hypothetical protein